MLHASRRRWFLLACTSLAASSAACGQAADPPDEDLGAVQQAVTSQSALTNVGDFGIYARNSVSVGAGARVHGGRIGVQRTGQGPALVPGYEVAIGEMAVVSTNDDVNADSLLLRAGATLGAIHANDVVDMGANHGPMSPLSKPRSPRSSPDLQAASTTQAMTLAIRQLPHVDPGAQDQDWSELPTIAAAPLLTSDTRCMGSCDADNAAPNDSHTLRPDLFKELISIPHENFQDSDIAETEWLEMGWAARAADASTSSLDGSTDDLAISPKFECGEQGCATNARCAFGAPAVRHMCYVEACGDAGCKACPSWVAGLLKHRSNRHIAAQSRRSRSRSRIVV